MIRIAVVLLFFTVVAAAPNYGQSGWGNDGKFDDGYYYDDGYRSRENSFRRRSSYREEDPSMGQVAGYVAGEAFRGATNKVRRAGSDIRRVGSDIKYNVERPFVRAKDDLIGIGDAVDAGYQSEGRERRNSWENQW